MICRPCVQLLLFCQVNSRGARPYVPALSVAFLDLAATLLRKAATGSNNIGVRCERRPASTARAHVHRLAVRIVPAMDCIVCLRGPRGGAAGFARHSASTLSTSLVKKRVESVDGVVVQRKYSAGPGAVMTSFRTRISTMCGSACGTNVR